MRLYSLSFAGASTDETEGGGGGGGVSVAVSLTVIGGYAMRAGMSSGFVYPVSSPGTLGEGVHT